MAKYNFYTTQGRSSLCSLHQLVFGSWISSYYHLLTALVKVTITILLLVVSIIVKKHSTCKCFNVSVKFTFLLIKNE